MQNADRDTKKYKKHKGTDFSFGGGTKEKRSVKTMYYEWITIIYV